MRAKLSDNPKLPTHSISVKVGEEFITVGACWTKDMKIGIVAEQEEDHTAIDPMTGIDLNQDIPFYL